MKCAIDILEERITAAMAAVTGEEDSPAIVTPATDARFGDYQANGVMALAKKMKANPRKLAEQVVESLAIDDICERPEVAGPGFINLRLKAAFIADRLLDINADEQDRLGIEKVTRPKTIVVDFSGPNIAKQMHVGHLRSTIIGDCICRLLEFLGHNVIPQNHIGDWGTQFGRVILGLWHLCMAEKHGGEPYYLSELKKLKTHGQHSKLLKDLCREIRDRHEADWREDSKNMLGDGEKFFKPFLTDLKKRNASDMWEPSLVVYQYVNMLEDSTEEMGLTMPIVIGGKEEAKPYESLSRHVTAMLQEGGNKNLQEREAWKLVTDLTLKHCDEIYSRLGVKLGTQDVRGESFYAGMLVDVVDKLREENVAEESDGAMCVFPEGFKNKKGEPLPFIIQKSDGAYLYATTDLAAIRYRINELKAQEVIYVTDARQKLHFDMLFEVADKAGWAKRDMLHHVPFGSVLGVDGKPLKTRSGENVKLKDLLDEAVERAIAIVEEKNPELDATRKGEIARAVGIGAVKYADYSNNRTSDYVFSFGKMLAMDGNTAPYMQYAYARIKSIERMAQTRDVDIETELAGVKDLNLSEPAEIELAKYLIRYAEAIEAAVGDYRPNYLTAYLYELAQKFSAFYTNCPVLGASPDKRPTRLLLCDLTARTIKHGLSKLLGIEVVEQM
jgi:arginyl-tRNA synthetase